MLLNFRQNLLFEKAIKLHDSGEINKAIKIYSSLIKKRLKDYLPKSPIFDSVRFTYNLENLYSKLLNI